MEQRRSTYSHGSMKSESEKGSERKIERERRRQRNSDEMHLVQRQRGGPLVATVLALKT